MTPTPMVACRTAERAPIRTGHAVTPDGLVLVTHRLAARSNKRGTAFLTHSQAQHTGNLAATFHGLAERGWDVHGLDLRGHGGSASARAPLADMAVGTGWDALVTDLRLGLETAFEGVPWEDRLICAPNIGAPLVLDLLKTWPDCARSIVFASPPPNQPALLKMASSIAKARMLLHPADRPDELILHQLYTFLGAQLADRERLIDVVSSDREVTDALLADPLAWPTPTTGYFHEMFRGIAQAWAWPEGVRLRAGSQALILYGGDDPVTANGRFLAPMRRQLGAMGFSSVAARRIPEGRAGLIIEEERFGLSALIAAWHDGVSGRTARAERPRASVPKTADPGDIAPAASDIGDVSADVLGRLGLEPEQWALEADDLVELCYAAMDDEDGWAKLLYRLAYAASAGARTSETSSSVGGSDDGAPGDDGLERLTHLLMPHWDRVYRLNAQIMRSAAIGSVLQNVVDRFRIGVAIVTDELEVDYANDPFLAHLERLSSGWDGSADGSPTARLRRLVGPDGRAYVRAGGAQTVLMAEGRAVGYHFRPRALGQTGLQRGGAAGVVVLRAADGTGPDDWASLLQLAYALTAKEAEVAVGLLRGLSPQEIAEAGATSIHTTRTHLRHIYDKVDVDGQSALIAHLMSGVIGLLATG